MEQIKQKEEYKPQSMYAKYLYEREGKYCIETSTGFATYELGDDYIYLVDIYTLPENRRNGECYSLADQVAKIGKSLNKTRMIGSVCPQANEATKSLYVLLDYGYKVLNSTKNMIYFEKEI